MLPPFKLPIELRPGQRRTLLARDLPACVFWWGFPDLTPDLSMRTFLGAMDRWERNLLLRAVIKPRLTDDQIARWGGASRRMTVQAYLEAVGFRAAPSGAEVRLELDELAEVGPHPEDAAFAAWVPRGALRQMLASTAKATLIAPALLWRGPISEMLFNCRVAMADELLDALATKAVARPVPAQAEKPKDNVVPFRAPRIMDVRDPLSVVGVEVERG